MLNAAEHWRDVALLRDGSVLTGHQAWALEGLEQLDHCFVQNVDEGQGGFLDKLRSQLAPTLPTTKQLAAELLWLMLLCPSNISAPARSVAQIRL